VFSALSEAMLLHAAVDPVLLPLRCRSNLKSPEPDFGSTSQQDCNDQLNSSATYQYRLALAVICSE